MNGRRGGSTARRTAAGGFLLALALLPCGSSPPRADDPVAAIRALYAATQEAIRSAREHPGESGVLYCTEVAVNRLDGMWRAVGNYARTTTFWFSDQPEFVGAEGRDPKGALVKAEVSTAASAQSIYEEFLFAEGVPVFYFTRTKVGEGVVSEDRLYFEAGRLVRRVPDPPAGEFPADPAAVLRRAAALQDLFLRTFD